MNIVPLGGVSNSAAGVSLAQSQGSETDRVRQDAAAQARQQRAAERADNAAGIAATDGEEHEAQERDADGRRLWEEPLAGGPLPPDEPRTDAPAQGASRDASGQLGHRLDLSG